MFIVIDESCEPNIVVLKTTDPAEAANTQQLYELMQGRKTKLYEVQLSTVERTGGERR
jgi:hypothetical protein